MLVLSVAQGTVCTTMLLENDTARMRDGTGVRGGDVSRSTKAMCEAFSGLLLWPKKIMNYV